MRPLILTTLLSIIITASLAAQPEGMAESCSCFSTASGEIFKVTAMMPLFHSNQCDEGMTYAERKACGDEAMLDFVYGNLEYPMEAYEQNIEGMAVVSFIIERNGCISSPSIVRNPGGGTGAEALRIIKLMVESGMKWVPGKGYDEEPVRVRFNLPIKFRNRAGDDVFLAQQDAADYYVACQTPVTNDTSGILRAFDAYVLDEQLAFTFDSEQQGKYVITLLREDGTTAETQTVSVDEGENMLLLRPELFAGGTLRYHVAAFDGRLICDGILAMY